jgi:hypothetical protein
MMDLKIPLNGGVDTKGEAEAGFSDVGVWMH